PSSSEPQAASKGPKHGSASSNTARACDDMGWRREGTRTTWLLRTLRSIPERSADQGDVSGDSAACSGARGRGAPPTWIDRGDIYPDPGVSAGRFARCVYLHLHLHLHLHLRPRGLKP